MCSTACDYISPEPLLPPSVPISHNTSTTSCTTSTHENSVYSPAGSFLLSRSCLSDPTNCVAFVLSLYLLNGTKGRGDACTSEPANRDARCLHKTGGGLA